MVHHNRKGSGTPEDAYQQPCPAGHGAAPTLTLPPQTGEGTGGGSSPPGVPPRHSRQRPNATAQLQLRTSWDGTSQDRALSDPRHPQCSGLPRRPVIVPAGRFYPEPPGSGGDEPPPAGTALAPPAGVAGWLPLRERDGAEVTIGRTLFKGHGLYSCNFIFRPPPRLPLRANRSIGRALLSARRLTRALRLAV